MSGNNKPQRSRNTFRIVLYIVIAVLVYGIAVQVTEVNLEEPLEPKRQENLIGLIRDLVHPDFFDYENITRSINVSLYTPCPDEIKGTQVSIENRVLTLSPNCADTTQDRLIIIGEGFAPNIQGIVRWYPPNSQSTRVATQFRTDSGGNFQQVFTMPDVRPSEEAQRLEVIERLDRSITGLSETSNQTIAKIIETVLMALMASTLGTILAIPISFLGARNLMSTIGSPLAAIMAPIIAMPIGGFIAYFATDWLVDQAGQISATWFIGIIVFALCLILVWVLLYAAGSVIVHEQISRSQRYVLVLRLVAALIVGIIGITVLGHLGMEAGEWLRINLHVAEIVGINFFGFIGEFILVVSELVVVLLPLFAGFIGALLLASYAARYGQEAVLHLSEQRARLVTAPLVFLGVAIILFAILYLLNWICIFGVCEVTPENINTIFLIIAAAAGLLAAILSLFVQPKKLFPIGMVTYMATRTTLNTLRAIEPLVMGFVLVVWLGIGPFAGVLALMLHSIADLGKLFSEQVENIDEGPLEAVTATGASKIQTIVYAVVPQIVPHYIAFIFYRWDINVRMSTVIGFVGGGGIGLILKQNTNLTLYSRVAVMIIAIAVVVTALDYTSSRIRQRII